MEHLTYHQVLADMYEETSKNVLVEQTEYEEEVPAEDKHPDELENQEEFQQQHGSRQAVEVLTHKPVYKDLTTNSVRYNKDVKTRNLSIDSRFRPINTLPTLTTFKTIVDAGNVTYQPISYGPQGISTQFTYVLNTPVKNVVSVRLSTVEIPNTFYNFSDARGNLSFDIIHPSGSGIRYTATIPPGNYTAIATGNDDDFALTIQEAMGFAKSISGAGINDTIQYTFNVDISLTQSVITISMFNGSTPEYFDLDFTKTKFANRLTDWGLGYNMGFRDKLLTGNYIYVGTAIVDTVGFNYLYVGLSPDWKVIQHNLPETANQAVFGKVIVNVPKYDVIYDNGSNTLTKEYWLPQPTDIKTFQITLSDPYEQLVDLVGVDWSLTVELKEILNPALYDHIREI